MAVGIVPAAIVGLREGIEAALVLGIVLAYLTKIGQARLRRYVFAGAGAAVAASLAGAALFAAFVGEFEGTAEELFEGIVAILAVVVLTSVVLWMLNAAKDVRSSLEGRIDRLVDRRRVLGLSALAFVAVFREGVETVLFAAGLAGAVSSADLVVGVCLGLLAAALLGLGIFAASWRIDLRRFFQATSVLLIVVAAGLFALGVHELQEAGVLPWLGAHVYDLSAVFPSDPTNPPGYLLRGLVGYSDSPTQLEVLAYASYWAFTAIVWWGTRTGRLGAVTRPLRNVWVAVKRVLRRVPAKEPSVE